LRAAPGVRVGIHASVAGGIDKAVANAVAAGCETFQLFVSNPRGWAERAADPAADERFGKDLAAAGLGPVWVHAPYLVNLASPSDDTRRRSAAVTAWTLRRAATLGASGVVVHAGSHMGAGHAAGLARTRAAVLPLLEEGDGPALLLELTAGAPNHMAARFEAMAELLAGLGDHPRLGVCFDTCHAHAAGYDLGTAAGATAAVDQLLAAVGDRVPLVHANDSRDAAGSGRDRHQAVGEGTIGEAGFAAVLAHPGLAGAAFVSETSGDSEAQKADVARLKALRPTPGPRR
jgi:deoxyribonuclease-4